MENLARESVYGVDGYATVQLDYLLEHYDEPLIIWSHSPATNLQLNLLKSLGVDAHISIGNIWDDLLREVSTWGTDDEIKTSPIPGSDLPLNSQVWQLVLQGFSAYVRFYAGWSMALAGEGARGSLVPIDQALDNEIAYLRRIVGSHASGSDAELRRCLDKAAVNAATTRHQTNPTLGPPLRSGIGYDVFPPDVRSAAQALYRRFPNIDFKMIDPRLCDVS